jgi:hypothetical protein
MKKETNTKKMLFEMMSKVNPDFKMVELTESDNYVTKKERIKKVIDDLFQNGDYDVIDTLYRLLVDRKATASVMAEHHSPEYKNKLDKLKGKLDFLFNTDHYDMIDKIDAIINKIYPQKNDEFELAESKNELFSQEAETFLQNVKQKNIELYPKFRNVILNKGLDVAIQKFNELYPTKTIPTQKPIDNKSKIQSFFNKLGNDFKNKVIKLEKTLGMESALYMTIGEYLQKYNDPFDYDELNDEEIEYFEEILHNKFPEFEY